MYNDYREIKALCNSDGTNDKSVCSAQMGHIGCGSKVIKPLRIIGKENISIGNRVVIFHNGRLEAEPSYDSRLEVGDGTSLEQACHIIL